MEYNSKECCYLHILNTDYRFSMQSIPSNYILLLFVGVLFSSIYVITALFAVVGSTVFNNIYYETRPIYKGLVFMVMAGSQLIGTILMM